LAGRKTDVNGKNEGLAPVMEWEAEAQKFVAAL
jgi:hypothetical protein